MQFNNTKAFFYQSNFANKLKPDNFFKKKIIVITLVGISTNASAALVSPCAGVSLPPSIVTNIVGTAVLPVAGTLDGALSLLLPALGLSSNLATTLDSIAAGNPINLNVLDTNGNIVSPATQCDTTSDSYTLDIPKGISIGGNQITGLGNGLTANAGELNSIAFGNNASTDVAATSSIAIGTNAAVGSAGANSIAIGSGTSASAANSVAIGAGSVANTGAQVNYNAFALPALQSSVGEISIGSAGNERKITNLAAGSSATDAVNVSQLQAISDNAVQYDPLSLKMTATLGGPLSNDGGVTNGTKVTNLSQGDISTLSTDAVNGSQLFNTNATVNSLGMAMATSLGGGATYNSSTGAITSPSYNVYGSAQNNVGDAITALQTQSPIQYLDGNGNTALNISNDVTLVGSTSDPVRLHNVAAGVAPTDAVNVSQLTTVSNNVDNLDALAVKYDDLTLQTISLGGIVSTDGGTTGGTKITNLSKGDISINSTDAVNGSQLFNITSGFTSNLDALGTSIATNLGGGSFYNSTTGVISSPSYHVYGSSVSNVGDAITALQTQSPLQYLDINGNPSTTPSNSVTLIGTANNPVVLHNVADGVDVNDAVNVGQLDAVSNQINTVNNNVLALDALAVKYSDPSQQVINLAGSSGTLLTNLQQGQISADSTDAVNGSQLFATHQMIMNISSDLDIKYFQVNSTMNDAVSSGTNSIAIGPQSLSSGDASVAMGMNSQATNAGAIAIGQSSLSSGVNSIAIGTGAVATGSVAVGAGAQAGNGGAAFGDNAIALTPQQGTAIGNAAVVTANRGVAIGASSTATRAGMSGTTERFSNTAVSSTEGAVSVGSAGAERQITNVAGGTADTDAVNVRQLDAAMAQSSVDMSNQISGLRAGISKLRDDAYGGIAGAMALASMPQSVIPGKVLIAAGAATYEGQSAMSIGVSNFSENGRWIVNLNGSANTRGKAGAAVGVGFHW